MLAATQKPTRSVVRYAIATIEHHPSKVNANVLRWPNRSCHWPNTNAPTLAVTFTSSTSTIVSCVVKPIAA